MLVTEEVALGRDTLHKVIGVAAQGPEPERVLAAIVDLLTEATACRACLIYLREGDVLRLRAASPAHAHHVGRIAMGLDDDPGMRHVPGLDEDGAGSTVTAPLPGRDGAEAIGVVVLRGEAPRELGQEAGDLLAHVARLVAGAVDNALRYEAARDQAARLSALTELTQEIATATRREELYRVVCAGVRRLLGADACRLHLADADGGLLEPAYASPRDPFAGTRPSRIVPSERALVAALTAGAVDVGMLVAERAAPFDDEEQRLLSAVGKHLAVVLQKAELIERLTEEHLVRDLFDALVEGRPQAAESRARAAGHDLDRPHVVAVLEPLGGDPDPRWPEVAARAEARLRRVVPGTLCDPGDERLRALLPVGAPDELARIDAELDRLAREERLAGGRSEPRRGLAGDERGLSEATSAAQVARAVAPDGGSRGYGDLGVYRYLAQLPSGHAPDERHARAIATLAAYDAKRRTELLRTLERHLGDRGALAATARALYIHTNTLRQRLDRIEALTDLVLADEDLLSLELALKLARLHGTS
ncbi:helix-turn-helix domain-containing protein [Baekduia sp. Peel2402]|uniref:helix-turn-helix domain-containing protein n=1 Tax=Baekduia sp. Peel2402 TaxID=3458296 RepID=UPI00403EDF90